MAVRKHSKAIDFEALGRFIMKPHLDVNAVFYPVLRTLFSKESDYRECLKAIKAKLGARFGKL